VISLSLSLSFFLSFSPPQAALEKERDFLASKLENRVSQVNGIRGDSDRTYERIKELEGIIEADTKTEELLQKKYDDYVKSSEDLMEKKKGLEKHIFDLRTDGLRLEAEYEEKRRMVKLEGKSLDDLDDVLINTKDRMERNIREYDNLFKQLQDITHKLEKQKNTNAKSQVEIEEKKVYIEQREYETGQMSKEIKKIQKMTVMAEEKIKEVDTEKVKADEQKVELDRQIDDINRVEIVAISRALEQQAKALAQTKGEMEVLRKKCSGSEKSSKNMADLIQMNINGRRNLTVEEKVLVDEIGHQKSKISEMIAEKEKFEHDKENVSQHYYTALEELKLQELQLQELQAKISDDQARLKSKQTLYEAVRSDRNLFSKQLAESQDGITALKRKFRFMNHTIEQLKEEIGTKDHAIVKEHFLHHSVDKERELLKNELTKIRKQVSASEGIIENQRVELLKLNRIIEEADQERRRQKNELVSIQAERKLLTGQMVKRNNELGEMYDKIKLQRSNLRIGERNYNKVMDSISKCRDDLLQVLKDQDATVVQIGNIATLKHKVVQKEKELLTLKTKTRALQDEFERPLNVHRWRVLESSDPQRYEKILQIQSLQKELVGKADEVVQSDLLIQEKEKAYMELKKIISRQPGPEVEEQVLVYQQTYKDKVNQLGAMDEELSMYRQQVQLFKEELREIDGNMDKVKKRWFKQRREKEA
jgi:chromosome segregation ATPase